MTIAADTSALLAIVFNEADFGRYGDALDQNHVLLSSASLAEALVVTESGTYPGRRLNPTEDS